MSRPIDQATLHETYSPKNYLTNILNDELKKKIEAPIFWRLWDGGLVALAQNRAGSCGV
jgi:hypothetical protein